jgi:hypothetical protein
VIARLARAALLAMALSASPVLADPSEDRTGLERLQAEDLRLQSIGWRLATGNAAFCDARPAIGLLLQDMANYANPGRMRAAVGISGDIAAQAVVAESPAAIAGLAPNHEILTLAGRSMTDLPPVKAGDWARLAALNDAIEDALARDGRISIAWRGADGMRREATVTGVPACPSRFELLDRGGRAVADGKRVLIGRKFAGFEYAEDEIAAAVAHEFAHNLLAHRSWLREAGRKRANIRLTEREADRLMPWLLANAGYAPDAAVRFFERWGPRNGGGLFRARTHDGWDERAAFVRAELPAIHAFMERGEAADWRAGFRREVSR